MRFLVVLFILLGCIVSFFSVLIFVFRLFRFAFKKK